MKWLVLILVLGLSLKGVGQDISEDKTSFNHLLSVGGSYGLVSPTDHYSFNYNLKTSNLPGLNFAYSPTIMFNQKRGLKITAEVNYFKLNHSDVTPGVHSDSTSTGRYETTFLEQHTSVAYVAAIELKEKRTLHMYGGFGLRNIWGDATTSYEYTNDQTSAVEYSGTTNKSYHHISRLPFFLIAGAEHDFGRLVIGANSKFSLMQYYLHLDGLANSNFFFNVLVGYRI